MSLDDPRVEWIRNRVYSCFYLPEPGCFEELLSRGDGEEEQKIIRFLNEVTEEESASTLLFFKGVNEEEIEVEIPIGPSELAENGDEGSLAESSKPSCDTPASERDKSPGDKKKKRRDSEASRMSDAPKTESTHPADDSQAHETEGTSDSEDEPPLTRIEIQVVYHMELHVAVNHVPERFMKSNILYFLRNTKETIIEPIDVNEANNLMPKLLEIGMLNGHSLLMLKDMLNYVYIPMLSVNQLKLTDGGYQQGAAASQDKEATGDGKGDKDERPVESRGVLMIRDELLNSTHKFLGHIERTLQQLEGEIKLHIPELDLEPEVDALLATPEVVEKLEQCVMNWQTQITIVIEEQQKKKPQVPGPMAEIDFWRERTAILSALSEQLKLPVVKKILEVMTKADPVTVQNLDLTVTELSKLHVESVENVRFLSTLERHFKNLATGADFGVILDTIPLMMNGLRMVWIISSHYNKDERMVPLMERIAWELSERVARVVNVRMLFKDKREVAKAKAQDGKQVLDQWKACYFEVRARIETSGRDPRWEFDRKKLFEKTDYMASICQDLYKILQILEEFYNIFGPELKAVTGDPKRIDDVLRWVDSLVVPIEELSFDPFNIRKMGSWKMVMQDFKAKVQAIEGEAINFIDQSFKTLRSASAAFDMLLKFKHIRSREAINNQMMMKFNDILAQYCKEVDIINGIFVKCKDNPPLNKNQPPVAGAIYWERSLFHHIKHTIIRFLEVTDMLESEPGKAVRAKYLEVGIRMKEYEQKKYERWRDETEQSLPLLMKRTLLTGPATERDMERGVRYMMNFAPELKEIISETKYLEQLGYSVPELARNVALQEDKFLRYVDGLKNLVNRYHSLMDCLNDAEFFLLAEQIQELRRVMRSGYKRLNWNALGISEFINRGTQAASKFESLVNQIQKNERDIDAKLQSIETANLFKFPAPDKSDDLPGVKEFCELIERERAKDLNLLSRKYTAIGPLLTKMESLIMQTNSGKAKRMGQYYTYWERKVFDSLTKMVLRNIQTFNMAMMGNTPLFQIETILSAPEIVLHPKNSEVYKLIMQCVRDCVESTKRFVRWMHGTCIECPPQRVDGEGESVVFSFYSEVCQHPQVNERAMAVSQNIQRLLSAVGRYLNRWKRYRPLWKLDKAIVMEKFAAKRPSYVMYDEKLQFYARVSVEVALQPLVKDEHIMRLNLEPLARTVQENAQAWVNSLGRLLNESAREDLFNLRDEPLQNFKCVAFEPFSCKLHVNM
uniref:Dynein heavy chain tail domain-containing protein n=2 Tax=Oncorhynchus TaxID=8016 RepID=A0AAZ3SBS5_ONCTS